VGRAEKWRSPFLGVGLVVRCERSEHGKSQLFVKFLTSFLELSIFLNLSNYAELSTLFNLIFSLPNRTTLSCITDNARQLGGRRGHR